MSSITATNTKNPLVNQKHTKPQLKMAVMSHNNAEGRLYESTRTRPIPYLQTGGQENGGDDDDDDCDVAPAA